MNDSTALDRPLLLRDAAESLRRRFGEHLAGARQATRREMLLFLAREMQSSEPAADLVLSRLEQVGAVAFQGGELAGDAESAHRQQWEIDPAALDDNIREIDWEAEETERAVQMTPALDLIQRAIKARATDIHLDPYGDEYEVRFRIDGRLEHFCRLDHEVAQPLVTQLKVMAELDIAEPFRPQEGQLDLPPALAGDQVRVTTVPVHDGMAVALRLFDRRRLLRPLSELGFSDESLRDVEELLTFGEGLVLIVGPTGSGKTTTMYSMVHALDDGHRNIVTIEDPVEFRMPSFLQMEVDPRHDVTLASGLKTMLRMDPDVVMLGEIRDPETADVAMRAASSGKYVFSTLHTRDIAATVTALADLHVDARSLAGNLRGIIAQRLVRRLCGCAERRPLEPAERGVFEKLQLDPPGELAHAVGCETCRGTGYHERIGIFEVEANSAALTEAIQDGVPEDELRKLLRKETNRHLATDALGKVAQGVTSLEEAQGMTWVSLRGRA